MKRYGFLFGLLAAPFVTHTVSSEAMPPSPVTTEMVAQEQRLAQMLYTSRNIYLITPKLTDALAKNMATLAQKKINVTVLTPKGGVSAASITVMKKAGVQVGQAPTTFRESAIATNTFIATGGILQGKRGANIIQDGLVGEEMLMSLRTLGKQARWY